MHDLLTKLSDLCNLCHHQQCTHHHHNLCVLWRANLIVHHGSDTIYQGNRHSDLPPQTAQYNGPKQRLVSFIGGAASCVGGS